MIDTVEATLAVIGVQAVISREVEKVRVPQLREMHELEKRINIEAKAIVRGETSKVPLGGINYKKTLNELTEGFDEGQLMQMIDAFPRELHAIGAQFLVKAKQTVQFLQSIFPIQTKTTLVGQENLPPSALAVRRFAVILDVVNDPMKIFPHIACGSLLKSQTDAVKLVFPTISEAITSALTEAATDEKAKKISFQLPAHVVVGSSVWLGMPRVNPRLAKRLQDNFAQQQAQQPNPQTQAEGGSNSVIAKEALSPTQKSLFPQATK